MFRPVRCLFLYFLHQLCFSKPDNLEVNGTEKQRKNCINMTKWMRICNNSNLLFSPSFCEEDPLSCNEQKNQSKDFIHSPVLIVYIWIVAVFSSAGNLILIASNLHFVKRKFHSLSNVQRIHTTMILNLAVADFLMGVYMCFIGGLALTYAGTYSNESRLKWRTTQTCSFIGLTNFVSCQVSVTSLVIMTTFRLYSVLHPYKHVLTRCVIACALLGWVVWLLVGFVPLIGSDYFRAIFSKFVLIRDNRNQLKPVLFELIETKFEWLHTKISQALNTSDYPNFSRNDILRYKQRLICDFDHVADFGYYGQQSLCTMKYFSHFRHGSSVFSLLVITFNFISFLYITLAYVYIYSKTVGTKREGIFCNIICPVGQNICCSISSESVSNQENENTKMKYLVIAIVITDFLCWVPISCVAFWFVAKSSELEKDDLEDFYKDHNGWLSTFALVVTPVNSIINPLLHSARIRSPLKTMLLKLRRKSLAREEQHEMEVCSPTTSSF